MSAQVDQTIMLDDPRYLVFLGETDVKDHMEEG